MCFVLRPQFRRAGTTRCHGKVRTGHAAFVDLKAGWCLCALKL